MGTKPRVEVEAPGRPLPVEAWRMIVRRYAAVAAYARGRRLLDAGCGAGLGLRYWRESGVASVVGIDAEAANIETARRLAGEAADLRVMDAHALDFPAASFDVVACMQVIQYLDAPRFLAEAARVLVPGGTLIVEMPNIRRRDGFRPSSPGRSYLSAGELSALLAAAGFSSSLHGAFAVPADAARPDRRALKRIKRWLVDAALAVPGGERLKDVVVARILPRVRVRAVTAADVAALGAVSALHALPEGDDGTGFQMIYAVARREEVSGVGFQVSGIRNIE